MQCKDKKIVIEAETGLFDLHLREIAKYRDLIWLFVKRNYSTRYKQMILGPAWLIISPIFTIITYAIVFGGIAGLSTDGVPQLLFYLAGNIFWSFFAECVAGTASTFTSNAGVFGKVYFPRLVTPISQIITTTFDFLIRLVLFFVFAGFYYFQGYSTYLTGALLYIPALLLQVGLLGLGIGIIVSALTTKYRDLQVLVDFGMRIWMYGTPVIYSISLVPAVYLWVVMLNPVSSATLMFRDIFFVGTVVPNVYWLLSWVITIVVLSVGILLFNMVEKTFMDTV